MNAAMRARVASSTLVLALALAGCATATAPSVPTSPQAVAAIDAAQAVRDGAVGAGSPAAPDPADPWEAFNRKVFGFNEALDTVLLKPAAEVYRKVVPLFVRQGVGHIMNNFADAWSGVNLLLQGRIKPALDTTIRVGLNTVFGVFGFFDVADDLGIGRENVEDFGQTLGRWGLASGPYLVLPVLGPSTVRDTTALLALDGTYSTPNWVLDDRGQVVATTAVRALNTRVKLMGVTKVLDDIALDKYVLMRDAFLARRRNDIYDGEPPEGDEPEEPLAGVKHTLRTAVEPFRDAVRAARSPASAAPPASAPAP